MSNGNLQRSDVETLPFEMGYLPPYFKRKAELELNESPENIVNGRKEMREMIKSNWDPETFPVPEFQRAVCVLLAQSLRDPMSQVNGYKVIFNAKGSSIKCIQHCTPTTLYMLYHGVEDCSPGRYKQFHMINMSSAARIIWFIFKSFISNKIKQRVVFHSTQESLLGYFPSSVLPKEYGGDLEEHDLTDWLKKVMEPEKLATIGGGPLPAPSLGIKGRKN